MLGGTNFTCSLVPSIKKIQRLPCSRRNAILSDSLAHRVTDGQNQLLKLTVYNKNNWFTCWIATLVPALLATTNNKMAIPS